MPPAPGRNSLTWRALHNAAENARSKTAHRHDGNDRPGTTPKPPYFAAPHVVRYAPAMSWKRGVSALNAAFDEGIWWEPRNV